MTVKLNSVVSKQLPDFVREDYPAFTQFVEAYYEFLDQTEKRNLTDVRDIDNTVEEFIQHFKNELNVFGKAEYEGIDKVLLMRKIKQIFTAKGSEAAYKFLFRILFDKPVQISYPWDQVLKPSDGKWKQEVSIFVDVTSGNANLLPGNNISVIGNNKVIRLYVERVTLIRNNIYEIFVNKNYYGNLEIGNPVEFDNFSGTIVSTIVDYTVEKAGSGFKVGDLVQANTIVGTETVSQLFKITKVDANGGIVKLSVITFGAGYSDNFYVLFSKENINVKSKISISVDSVPQLNIPENSNVEEYNDFGYITNPNYWNVVHSDPTYAGTLLREFYNNTPNNVTSLDFSLINFKIGAVAKYQGYYVTNDGFLDDIIKIQDSFYYQKYSYLITIDERLEDYKTILKSYIHAAGTKLFGEYQIQNTYAPGIEGKILVDTYTSKATYRVINRNITNQFTNPTDMGGRIRIEPYDLEDYFALDYNPETYQTFTG